MNIESDMTPLDKAQTMLIRYPRFEELHQSIRECLVMSHYAGEPHCMSLEGVTGAGKSTLINTYLAAFPRYETETGSQIPIFYVPTPSPVTVKGMAATMLAALGDPAAYQGALWTMNTRLIHFLKVCRVQLVILDDFQHLVDAQTNRVLREVSNWLKTLIKETRLPFLVTGIEGEVVPILETNSQLSRLFAARETLEPFAWDNQDPQTQQNFARFVHYAEQGLGLMLSAELPRMELLYRLYAATNGVVGNMMNLLRQSTYLAQQTGQTTLTLAILSQAFRKRLGQHVGKPDPFLTASDPLFTVPQPLATDPPDSTGQRRWRRWPQSPSVAEVLKTR
ncbi:MAG: TniB family NTP-binding protein [Chloroflexi bacterium]|nr:TniB family NTP-binding protein [Chloroflexota bacterium]